MSVLERQWRFRLSAAAMDVLMRRALVQNEGRSDRGRYLGTTMVTIDIALASDLVADPCSPETAAKLAGLMEHDPGVIRMIRSLALAGAVRTAGYSLAAAHMDLKFRASGTKILIDVDTETERKAA
ncbi:MAG: hypothetical protein IPL79_14565 [Myxococcales bacterium]|nr:hypothetical protein [Myxococcales bacterium]